MAAYLDLELMTVSPQVTWSQPAGKLPVLSAGPVVTFLVTEHHRSLAGTKLHRFYRLQSE